MVKNSAQCCHSKFLNHCRQPLQLHHCLKKNLCRSLGILPKHKKNAKGNHEAAQGTIYAFEKVQVRLFAIVLNSLSSLTCHQILASLIDCFMMFSSQSLGKVLLFNVNNFPSLDLLLKLINIPWLTLYGRVNCLLQEKINTRAPFPSLAWCPFLVCRFPDLDNCRGSCPLLVAFSFFLPILQKNSCVLEYRNVRGPAGFAFVSQRIKRQFFGTILSTGAMF